jgi:hypothetical protein
MEAGDILDFLHRTGRLPELQVVRSLIQREWKAQHSATYADLDEQINREVDVLATKFSSPSDAGVFFIFHLAVEVKHSEGPWIALVTPASFKRSPLDLLTATNTRSHSDAARLDERLPFLSANCYEVDYLRERAVHFARSVVSMPHKIDDTDAKRGKSQTPSSSRATEAILQSVKAARFFTDQAQEQYNQRINPKHQLNEVRVFHPVVVTDAQLFTVRLEEDGKEVVEEQEWIPAIISYSSPSYRKGTFGDTYYPDIVSLRGFEAYLARVESWIAVMAERMKKEATPQIERLARSRLEGP